MKRATAWVPLRFPTRRARQAARERERRRAGGSLWTTQGVTAAATTGLLLLGIVYALDAAAPVLIPITLGLLLALALQPVAGLLERFGLPPIVAAILAVGMTLAAVAMVGIAIGPSVQEWTERAPALMEQIRRKLEPVTASLESVSQASKDIAQAATGGDQGTRVVVADASMLIAIATTAPSILANAGFIFLIAFLVLAERRVLRRQVIRLGGTLSFRRRLAETMRDLHRNVSRYLFTVTCINVVLGIVTAAAMAVLDMPSPAIWGVANAALNFVPYLGPIAVMCMAGAVGLVTYPDPLFAIYPVLALIALNIVESQFVTPYFLARRWQMSPLAVVVAVTVGAALWDIAGAIVAAPVLVVLTTIGRHIVDGRVTQMVRPPPRTEAEPKRIAAGG